MDIRKLAVLAILPIFLVGCKTNEPASESGSESSTSQEHEHTFSNEWTSDATHHWHASTCGHDVVDSKAEHSFGEWIIDDEPQVDHDGHRYKECSVCHYHLEDTIEQLDKVIDTIEISGEYLPKSGALATLYPFTFDNDDLEITSRKWEHQVDSSWEDMSTTSFVEENTYAFVVTFSIKSEVSHRVFAETVTCTYNGNAVQQVNESTTSRTYRIVYPEVPSPIVNQIHVTVPERPLRNVETSSTDAAVDDEVYSTFDAYWQEQNEGRLADGTLFDNSKYYKFTIEVTLDSDHVFPNTSTIQVHYRLKGKEYNVTTKTMNIQDSKHGTFTLYNQQPDQNYISSWEFILIAVPSDGITPEYNVSDRIQYGRERQTGSSTPYYYARLLTSYYEVYENDEWVKLTTAFEVGKRYRSVFNFDNSSIYSSYFYNIHTQFRLYTNDSPIIYMDATSVIDGAENAYGYDTRVITAIFDYGVLSSSKKITSFNMSMPKKPIVGEQAQNYDIDSVTFDNDLVLKLNASNGTYTNYVSTPGWGWYEKSGSRLMKTGTFQSTKQYYLQFEICPEIWDGYYITEDAVITFNTDEGEIIIVERTAFEPGYSRASDQQITIKTPLITPVSA